MSPKKNRTKQEIEKEIAVVTLQFRRGEISPAMYERNTNRLYQELGSTPGSGNVAEPEYRYVTSDTTGEFTDAEMALIKSWNDRPWRGIFGGFLEVPSLPVGDVAEKAWNEHDGVVLCECESLDCDRVIEITKDEYIHAAGPGWQRVTHPDCPYGILNSKLIQRTKGWNVWSKER